MFKLMPFISNGSKLPMRDNDRKAAAGKGLLVYLFSGSIGLALLAFVLFKMVGW